jgi:hypothetical protein
MLIICDKDCCDQFRLLTATVTFVSLFQRLIKPDYQVGFCYSQNLTQNRIINRIILCHTLHQTQPKPCQN